MLRRLASGAAKVAWTLEPCRGALRPRWYAGGANAAAEDTGWIPWLKNKLPEKLGGNKELHDMENMTIDAYAASLRVSRIGGSVRGYVGGTSKIQDTLAQGNIRLFEDIIGAMNPDEKADLSLFDAAARQQVALKCCCTVSQVNDCIAKFEWVKQMMAQMASLKRQGKPIPSSLEELEQSGHIISWRQKRHQEEDSEFPGTGVVPRGQLDSKGRPCPLRGMNVGRSTKCRLTKKSWKSCCGKAKLK